MVNVAIEYGLVEPAQGREILARLWAKMDREPALLARYYRPLMETVR